MSNAPVRAGSALAEELGRAQASGLVSTSRGSPVDVRSGLPRILRALRSCRVDLGRGRGEPGARSSGTEWFLDNYYLIEQSMSQVTQDLPDRFYRELPFLTGDAAAGVPRSYVLAAALLTREEYQLDQSQLFDVVDAYQDGSPLTLGETWVLPSMLRLVLLEAITEAVTRLTGESAPDDLDRHRLVLDAASEDGTEADAQLPGPDEVIAAGVVSLRLLDRWDWKPAAERISRLHRTLLLDPSGDYPRMDYDTRDRYRRAAEELARRSPHGELDVARAAVELASLAPEGARERHVGHLLVDAGRPTLEAALGYRPRPAQAVRRALLDRPTATYLVPVFLVAALLVAIAAGYAGRHAPWAIVPAALLALVPAVTAAVELVNWALARVLPTRVLPKLDLTAGIPDEFRALVVVPGLASSTHDIDALLANVRLHHLRNPDPALTFAVLSDFPDAPTAETPQDAAVLDHARQAVAELNTATAGAPFLVLHRRRQWNPAQGTWMAWERKRGKLHELNRLLRGATDTSFLLVAGSVERLAGIRYVITLDADTVLPPDAANRLVGTLAHPLNHARFDGQGRVVAGYTVLQPRAETDPAGAGRSLFTRAMAGDSTVDLYNVAVSDAYADLFGEGIYMGKGIYDVDAFERSLAGRIPENTLLSHDLFEGVHGRAGLVSDITVYEDYPPNYLVSALRQHRWIRGDWQLLPWLGSRVPTERGPAPTPLALIDRWKLADNLRRSLVPIAAVALLAAGWLWLPGSPLVWTLLALLTPLASLLAALVATFVGMIRGALGERTRRWQAAIPPLRRRLVRALLQVAGLGIDALLSADAIVRTLWRTWVSHRHLLEWTTAAGTIRLVGHDVSLATAVREALPATVLTAVLGTAVAVVRPSTLPSAGPILLAWLAAPFLHYLVSRPDRAVIPALTHAHQRTLRTLARRTWLFFEQFVGPEDNWLPPDNYQEEPLGVVAHRTSPTNIGLYLLSTLAAHDRGYLGTLSLVTRLEFAFDSLERLEHHRGHPLNWVDTRTLQPLPPRYVSTVDSGNLAACLVTLAQGCAELPGSPVWPATSWQGLADAVALVADQLGGITTEQTAFADYLRALEAQVAALDADPPAWPDALPALLDDVRASLPRLLAQFVEHAGAVESGAVTSLRMHTGLIQRHLEALERDVRHTLPRIALPPDPAWFATPSGGPAAQAWQQIQDALPLDLTWADLPDACRQARDAASVLLTRLSTDPRSHPDARAWVGELTAALRRAETTATGVLAGLQRVQDRARELVTGMDFGFLYDRGRGVFHIGYNLDAGRLDDSYYDLLASESRIASLVAIAKRDVPQEHWLHLARPMTRTLTGDRAIISWSGTMFEYLMPTLIVRTPPDSLLGRSCAAIVAHQIAYGRRRGVPWGISESGFYAFDAGSGYQYRAFGAPGTGLTRGLADDLVVAPYASLLALPYDPHAVLANLDRLEQLGAVGGYGLYEAIDFTASRLPAGQAYGLVRSHMAHHQGMIMLALAARLDGPRMVGRFHREPFTAGITLLVQEQVTEATPERMLPIEADIEAEGNPALPAVPPTLPWTAGPQPDSVAVHWLSNGRYGVLITDSGGGYSAHQDLMLTRWRADSALDQWGTWLYLQDLETGGLWSATAQPGGVVPEDAVFSPARAEFRQRHAGIHSHLDITVAAHDDVEIRLLDLADESGEERRIGVTSYAEIALATAGDDLRHPAFSKLFVEAEALPEVSGLLLRRRPRSADEPERFVVTLLVRGPEPDAAAWGRFRCTSDRAGFLGRHRGPDAPAALDPAGMWWTAESRVPADPLDPAAVLGQEVALGAHGRVRLAVVTGHATSRERALALAARYQVWSHVEHAFTAAVAQAEQELRDSGFAGDDLGHTQRLLGMLLFPPPAARVDPPEARGGGPSALGSLWGLGISGDLPILYVGVADEADLALVEDTLRAHRYWALRGLPVDLVILDEQPGGYAGGVRDQILGLVGRHGADRRLGRRGGVFLVRHDQLGSAERTWLRHAARVVFEPGQGDLAHRLAHLAGQAPVPLPHFDPQPSADTLSALGPSSGTAIARPEGLLFDNGRGGFSADGREYLIHLEPGVTTPAPWANVIATPEVGCLATEAGLGTAWALNSGENRLTPWRNDPLSDLPSQVLYLRDEETGGVWSTTPQPCGENRPTLVRHGAGYTSYECAGHALHTTTTVFAGADPAAVIVRVRLTNQADRPRRLTLTFVADLVLGGTRDVTRHQVSAHFDDATGAILARNPFHPDLPDQVTYLATTHPVHGWTTDRLEVIGRMGTLARPAGLTRIGLARRSGAGVEPCAALQVHLDLPAGGSDQVSFLLGQAAGPAAVAEQVDRLRRPGAIEDAWRAVGDLWDGILGAVEVRTPDPALDLLLNRWLPYQTVAARLWGRTGVYQSSGAYGFRDQLQDVLALLGSRPDLAREHLLRAAAHQFEEGDVLHWWHPPAGRGVRTRISDDLLWLPYVTAHYVRATGDESVLAEQVPFRHGAPLAPEEAERYDAFRPSDHTADLLDHCRLAVRRGLTPGAHGLPLIGTGDWNDGMNRVGAGGRGESVWLGWFGYAVLTEFAGLCERSGHPEEAATHRDRAQRLHEALEAHAWDGRWYLRAFYDDGRPLGSAQSREGRIDSIAQSWSVLSGAPRTARTEQALASAIRHLVRWDDRLALLLTPPFDRGPDDPGYLRGYLPGVRENGGQYTHAAAWLAWAAAESGDAGLAYRLFDLLNPIRRTVDPAGLDRYLVEPYVLAGDLYSRPPHVGRGGWTWYTGSAGWLYRVGVEAILGLSWEGGELRVHPRLPESWDGFTATVRRGGRRIEVTVRRDGDGLRVEHHEHPATGSPMGEDADG